MLAKKQSIKNEDFDVYQKVLRNVSHRYIHIIKGARDVNDDE